MRGGHTIVKRWKKAQAAERKYYLRNPKSWDINWDVNIAKEHLFHNFNLDLSFFLHKELLEVGAGAGLINFIDTPCLRIGIDPLASFLKDKVKNRLSPDVDFIEAIGEEAPLRDDTFDVILCINTLDHCMFPEKVLREARRLLRPQGLLLLQVNTFRCPKVIRSLLSSLDRPHPHHFSSKELCSLAEKCGFRLQSMVERRPPLRTLKRWKGLSPIYYLDLHYPS